MKFRIKNKSKKIFLIYSDEKVWGILPAGVLHFFSLKLEEEIDLSEEKSEELLKYVTDFARDRLLNFLSYRERSKWECKIFLQKLPLDNEISEKLVEEAVSNNYINDERFAEMYVENLIQKRKNRSEIKTKLYEKHISGKIIENVLSKKITSEKADEILSENVQKALAKYAGFPEREKIVKCLNYLTRRSFSYYDVKAKINELIMKE